MLQSVQRPLLILDFGSQYTQLIARRLREMGVYCVIYPYNLSIETFKTLNPCGAILSGGPATVTLETNPRAPEWLFKANIPLLGICYGMQTMAAQLGGAVSSSNLREFGYAKLAVSATNALLQEPSLDVWMSHGDKVTKLPAGFTTIAKTDNAPIAAMADEAQGWYGLQFHPEVTHTPLGMTILRRFVVDICKAATDWTPEHILEESLQEIRQQVGKDKVLLGLSGGVDSSVVAALLHRAIGKQLVCVFVDTGLLRLHEEAQVRAMFAGHSGMEIIFVPAAERFLKALKGIDCPEEKRKIVGRVFIEVFDEEAAKIKGVAWLAQGTIYPDVIESAGHGKDSTAVVIKSHHNVGGLPSRLHLKLLEPLRLLFKDEVRALGLALGLGENLVYRHPFPGPGLSVRILGEVKEEYISILRFADAIFIEELQAAQLYHKVSQAFAVFLPVKSVGVVGDSRSYDYVICLRAVETQDFMTAHWSQLPWDFLAKVSNRIINEVAGVSRVTYDISGKPPATIEWE
jgi:GMP synthase (glutamine-hydrolysing)